MTIDYRWRSMQKDLTWENQHATSCPPHGLVRMTGYSILADGRVILQGTQPTSDSVNFEHHVHGLNGPTAVPGSGGKGTLTLDVPALLAVSAGAISANSIIKPSANSWLGAVQALGDSGYIAMGPPSNGIVMVNKTGGGGGVQNYDLIVKGQLTSSMCPNDAPSVTTSGIVILFGSPPVPLTDASVVVNWSNPLKLAAYNGFDVVGVSKYRWDVPTQKHVYDFEAIQVRHHNEAKDINLVLRGDQIPGQSTCNGLDFKEQQKCYMSCEAGVSSETLFDLVTQDVVLDVYMNNCGDELRMFRKKFCLIEQGDPTVDEQIFDVVKRLLITNVQAYTDRIEKTHQEFPMMFGPCQDPVDTPVITITQCPEPAVASPVVPAWGGI